MLKKIMNYLRYRFFYNVFSCSKYNNITHIPLAKEEKDVYIYYIEVLKYLSELKPVRENKSLFLYVKEMILFIHELKFNKNLRKEVKTDSLNAFIYSRQNEPEKGFYYLYNWRSDKITDSLGQPLAGGFNRGQQVQRIIAKTFKNDFTSISRF